MDPLRPLLLLLPALLVASLAPAATAAVDLCENGVAGNRVCVERDGLCASVVYLPPWTDFAAGAGECPDVAAGSDGATACQWAFAGYANFVGFFGYAGTTCVLVYEDDLGRTCVRLTQASNLGDVPTKPVCR